MPPPNAEQPLGRVVDNAFLAAKRLGADRSPVAIAAMHRLYCETLPQNAPGRSPGSFHAAVGYHTINMRSRFPNPKAPRASASWINDPMFYRTGHGQYRILTAQQVVRFREAVNKADPRIHRPEYDAADLVGPPR